MIFFSLQGLGDSILNFPALTMLRNSFDVEVLCFNNGSSAFFKAFHPKVREVKSKAELLRAASLQRAETAYICYPVWKKEMSSALFSPCPKRYFLRPPHWLGRALWPHREESERWGHQLENNITLVERILETPFHFNPAKEFAAHVTSTPPRTLAIHPTASTIFKYYPLAFWGELLRALQNQFDHVDIYCGKSEDELHYSQSVQQFVPASWTSQVHPNLDFGALAKQLAKAKQFVGSDSSLMHLAALLDTPVVGLWSFADYRTIFPYGNLASVYIPEETLSAKSHEYPRQHPDYLRRAKGQAVAEIVMSRPAPSFTILPRTKNQVYFYTF